MTNTLRPQQKTSAKNCNKTTEFNGLQNGYREFCSRTCFWQVTTKSEEVKEKRKKTCLKSMDQKVS